MIPTQVDVVVAANRPLHRVLHRGNIECVLKEARNPRYAESWRIPKAYSSKAFIALICLNVCLDISKFDAHTAQKQRRDKCF